MRIRTLWAQLAQDLGYAIRTMAVNPLFTSMAVLSLALGIGANTAIYSFMEAILIRALPVTNPQSLVVFNWRSKDFPGVAHSFNGSNYKDKKLGMTSGNFPFPAYELLAANPVCSYVFAFANAGRLNLIASGQADLGDGQYVSGAYFPGLGLSPAAGRLLNDDDDRAAAAVVVVSDSYARKRFGDASHAVGQKLLVNNQPFTIVGVAPPKFWGVNPAMTVSLYIPMHASAILRRDASSKPDTRYVDRNRYWVEIMGRLKPGVSLAQAQQPLTAAFKTFVESTAASDKERADLPAFYLEPGAQGLDGVRRQYAEPLYVLMTLVGFILAIACANIANLLLARATGRRREMAIRLSLGAGRARVVRQLLTESVMLSALGGVLGVILASWGIQLLTVLIGNGRENFTLRAALNWNVLTVTVGIALLTGLLFGLAPALQATSVDLVSSLKQTRAAGSGMRLRRGHFHVSMSQVLVTAQIAISLLLLVAAGLFLRTLSKLGSVELGFNRENILLFSLDARQAGYRGQALATFYDNLREKVREVPGVRNVAASSYTLVSQTVSQTSANVPGAIPSKDTQTAIIDVAPGFFATMQIPMVLGRELDERDQAAGAHVAVVNQLFARKFFGDANPIGRRFGLGRASVADIEIVGVCRTARHQSLKQDIPAVAYTPYSMDTADLYGLDFEVRTAGDPLALTEIVRKIVHQADARIPIHDVGTQAMAIDQTISKERTFGTLCTWFAILAVLIACVGLYGTMAYSVARRTNEIGLRMALGAHRGRLVWSVMREVLTLAAAGLAVGIPVALMLSHLVESYLFGMKAKDPVVLIGAPLALLIAALIAGYGPALRASRIDPWTALRNE